MAYRAMKVPSDGVAFSSVFPNVTQMDVLRNPGARMFVVAVSPDGTAAAAVGMFYADELLDVYAACRKIDTSGIAMCESDDIRNLDAVSILEVDLFDETLSHDILSTDIDPNLN